VRSGDGGVHTTMGEEHLDLIAARDRYSENVT
jgi:hypothetical protein